MLTAEQQMMAANMREQSPAVRYGAPDAGVVSPDDEVDAIIQKHSLGEDPAVTKALREQEVRKQIPAELFMAPAPTQKEKEESAADVGKGIGLGIRKFAQNMWNGVVTFSNAAEDFAAAHGIGKGDLITESAKWTDPDAAKNVAGLGVAGKSAHAITQFAAPLLAGYATGGGALAGLSFDAAYAALAIDPKDARLADHLKGTWAQEIPVAASVIEALSTKPDDTELMSRMKNLAEGMGISAPLAGLAWGAGQLYARSARGVVSATDVQGMPKGAPASQKPAAGAPGAPEVPPVVDVHAQISKQATATGEVLDFPNLNDDQMVEKFYEWAAVVPDQDRLRAPMTDAEMLDAAKELRSNPAIMRKIAESKPTDVVLTDKETDVLRYLMQRTDDTVRETVAYAMNNLDDENILVYMARQLENWSRVADIRTGAASAKGATLRAEQIIEKLARAGDAEAQKQIAAEGRAMLTKHLIDAYGGKERLQDMVKNLDFLRRLEQISKMPDDKFPGYMKQVKEYSLVMGLDQAITKVAVNGMISSPMTAIKAIATNSMTTTKTIIDNYLSVGFGAAFRNEDRMTLREANAHVTGTLSGLIDAALPAVKILNPKTPMPNRPAKIDTNVIPMARKTTDQVAMESMGAWASVTGFPTKVVDAVNESEIIGYPARVLVSIDNYWQRVNESGYINAQAHKLAASRGLTGREAENFIESFRQNPPRQVKLAAYDKAQTNTMARELEEGSFAHAADQLIERFPIPAKRAIIPFFKTSANSMRYTLDNTPLALLPGGGGRLSHLWGAIAEGGRARDEALAKMASGSIATGMVAFLASQGLVNGKDSDNVEVNRALKDNKTVAPQTSIRVGDTWVSVAGIEPVASIINGAAMLTKASGYMSEDDYTKMAHSFVASILELMSPEQLVDTATGIVGVMDGNKDGLKFIQSIPQRFVPFGAAMTDVRQTVDPTLRDTTSQYKETLPKIVENMKLRIQNMVPYYSKDLPAQRNIWGEKLVLPDGIGPDSFSPFATSTNDGMAMKRALEAMDNYYEETRNTNAGLTKFIVSMPQRTIRNPMANGNVVYQLTPQEYSSYVMLTAGVSPDTGEALIGGQTLKQAVSSILKEEGMLGKEPKDFDPISYARIVGKLSAQFLVRKQYADAMILQRGDIKQKMLKDAEQYWRLEHGR